MVLFEDKVDLYLRDLTETLYQKEYFGTFLQAKKYIDDLYFFIIQNIEIITKRPAPFYFRKFGKNLKYITYKRNKQTTWYVFFQQKGNRFLVKHISNNHDPKISKKL